MWGFKCMHAAGKCLLKISHCEGECHCSDKKAAQQML